MPWPRARETPLKFDPQQHALALRAFAAAQLFTYELTLGWFFWSYKVETHAVWSFRDSVRLGYLPGKLP